MVLCTTKQGRLEVLPTREKLVVQPPRSANLKKHKTRIQYWRSPVPKRQGACNGNRRWCTVQQTWSARCKYRNQHHQKRWPNEIQSASFEAGVKSANCTPNPLSCAPTKANMESSPRILVWVNPKYKANCCLLESTLLRCL